MNNFLHNAPVGIGEKIRVKIRFIGRKGDGIGNYKGYKVIVPSSVPEEEVEVIVRKFFRKTIIAEKT